MKARLPSTAVLSGANPSAASTRLTQLGAVVFAAGVSAIVAAVVEDLPMATAIGTFLTGAAITSLEIARSGPRGLNPISIAAVMFGVGGVADLIALLFEDSDRRGLFFFYESSPHIATGLLLVYVGLVSLWVGYRWSAWRLTRGTGLPSVWVDVGEARLVMACVATYFIRLLASEYAVLDNLGTVGSLFLFAGPISAFLLTRRGAETKNRGVIWIGVTITIIDTIRAAMFEILRLNMVLPLLAGALGLLIGSRSFRALMRPQLIPVYMLLVIGLPFFGTFAKERTTLSYGPERFSEIYQRKPADDDALWAVIARFTTLNQVSQVVRLVENHGHYDGETMDYLLWVWIPRFLWPDKPSIAKGQWFAAEIGQGIRLRTGAFSNSINMTIPGELYLNFGWAGVVIGCMIIGGVFHVLWRTAEFWRGGANPWGNVLGFFALYSGAIVVIDLQLVVTLIASYLLVLGLAASTRLFQPRRSRVLAARVPASTS